MKDFDIRIRNGGDDAIAAVSEYVKELEGEVASARACAEMMLQGTGQKIGEEWARRVMDQHSPPQWIPVSERLPDDGVEVLVCFKGEIDSIEIREFLGGLGGVTHWMPLPEPPEVR